MLSSMYMKYYCYGLLSCYCLMVFMAPTKCRTGLFPFSSPLSISVCEQKVDLYKHMLVICMTLVRYSDQAKNISISDHVSTANCTTLEASLTSASSCKALPCLIQSLSHARTVKLLAQTLKGIRTRCVARRKTGYSFAVVTVRTCWHF